MVKISSLLIKWKQAASGQHLPKLLSHLTFFVFVFAASTRMKKHITNTKIKNRKEHDETYFSVDEA
jgi:hypothetical protein